MNNIQHTVLKMSAVLCLVSSASCAPAPPATAPDYSAPPPEISQDFHIENQEVVTIDLPRDDFLRWKKSTDLSSILTATEGMPAVERTVMLSGGEWGDVGDRRRVELADGHYAVETILESTDERFRYQVWGFTNQAGQFADYAMGEFIYEDKGDHTVVTWTYRFRPNSRLARIPLSRFVRNSFQGFMENGLSRMKSEAENSTS